MASSNVKKAISALSKLGQVTYDPYDGIKIKLDATRSRIINDGKTTTISLANEKGSILIDTKGKSIKMKIKNEIGDKTEEIDVAFHGTLAEFNSEPINGYLRATLQIATK